MATNKKFSEGITENIFSLWTRRCPSFEKRYEGDEKNPSVIRILTDYGKGTSKYTEDRGKILGPGYEAYIMAFFIGLYAGRKLSLTPDTSEKKDFGWPIDNWTGVDRGGRNKYENLRHYIFIALVAKTEIDWLALDEGKIEPADVVSLLIKTMEEYANYGFYVMAEKLKDKSYFYSNRSFLDLFLELTTPKKDDPKKPAGPGPIEKLLLAELLILG